MGDLPHVQERPEFQRANPGFAYEYQFIGRPAHPMVYQSPPRWLTQWTHCALQHRVERALRSVLPVNRGQPHHSKPPRVVVEEHLPVFCDVQELIAILKVSNSESAVETSSIMWQLGSM